MVLMLGAVLASTLYVSKCGIVFIIWTQRRLFHTVPEWLVSYWFVEIFVCIVVLSAGWFFGNFRDRFLRRNHLKVAITDYQNDWVEFTVSDTSYFEELENQSEIFS